jgi:hypothetical protein
MLRKVTDLSAEERAVIEKLLGRPIGDRELVFIDVCLPPATTQEERDEVVERLKRLFDEMDAYRQPVSPVEEEEIIDEALRSTRPNYRPIR